MLNFNDFVNVDKSRSQRQLKVAEMIRRALSEIFSQGMISSPLLFEKPLTISLVKVSPDLTSATILFYPFAGVSLSENELKEVLEELRQATPYIRSLLAKRVKLRSVPHLSFKIDKSYDLMDKLNNITKEQEETE